MAQDGDTITYTYDGDLDDNDDLLPEEEDVSAVDEMVIEYVDGAGGADADATGGNGGRVEGTVVDISSYDTIYIWVGAAFRDGRYAGGSSSAGGVGAGSTEIWFEDTNQTDSDDEPFIVGGGGGGGAGGTANFGFGDVYEGGGGGARGGIAGSGPAGPPEDGEGVAPPLGGDGGDASSDDTFTDGTDGDGAVNTDLAEVTDGGTTTKGGGSASGTDAEVQISYAVIPDAPTNLSATLQ